ncbi:MAG TPA: hypothetical protein VGE28_09905 [Pseudomonas sp.]
MRHLLCLVVALALAGCTTNSPSVPENYSGPLAQLNDSARTYSTMRADLFFVEELNGVKIDNSLEATRLSNQGRGMVMTPAIISRPVVAEETLKVGVKGRTHFAAPILAMAGTVYQVKGVVAFTPRANGKYTVRGEFGEKYSSIWIEDAVTGQPVGNKVEFNGSAKLGLLEK